ncbi:MAG TPA: zinc-binding dehydrogenase [Kofleriaceae bacterium]|nr:zinc-binding dehydrogenase [Kofleriaceae bacterium]
MGRLNEAASDLIRRGKLRSIVHRSYPFAELREAFVERERGRARGKIVVTI